MVPSRHAWRHVVQESGGYMEVFKGTFRALLRGVTKKNTRVMLL